MGKYGHCRHMITRSRHDIAIGRSKDCGGYKSSRGYDLRDQNIGCDLLLLSPLGIVVLLPKIT
jgi:hypothetical protein